MALFAMDDHRIVEWPAGTAYVMETPREPSGAAASFEEGRSAARKCRCGGGYVLLEGAPETDEAALISLAAALGYERGPEHGTPAGKGVFETLDLLAPPGTVFAAGCALEASRRCAVVLRGSLEMAAALLIADRIAGRDGLPMDPRRILFVTTPQIAETYGGVMARLFDGMDFSPRLCCETEA